MSSIMCTLFSYFVTLKCIFPIVKFTLKATNVQNAHHRRKFIVDSTVDWHSNAVFCLKYPLNESNGVRSGDRGGQSLKLF
jgi:hypothetical protein